jgi:hypothetical protein
MITDNPSSLETGTLYTLANLVGPDFQVIIPNVELAPLVDIGTEILSHPPKEAASRNGLPSPVHDEATTEGGR